MEINLVINELMFDIQNKSQMESQKIPDPVERYRVEVGAEKKDEIGRCITKAVSELELLCNEWINTSVQEIRYDDIDLPSSDFTFASPDDPDRDKVCNYYKFIFDMGERRASGKAKVLADLLHSYVVSKALYEYYLTVGMVDFANVHNTIAQSDALSISLALHTKKQPIL